MTPEQFDLLSSELRALASKIPLRWGRIQNDEYDHNINMFELNDYISLENAIKCINDENMKNYLRRRWYIWQCARCDEYLFCSTGFAEHNPDYKSKEYDVLFLNNNQYKFDIKGTVIPQLFRNQEFKTLINAPEELAKWFFESQSKGIRFDVQNRLFIIHHSMVDYQREMYLRCAWQSKMKAYTQYISLLKDGKRFVEVNGIKADFIWLVEEQKGIITPYFYT